MFKVGDKVRRFKGSNFGNFKGYIGTVQSISPREAADKDGPWLNFTDGTRGFAGSFELVAPTGPVVTETVTKTRIVPGVYDFVVVEGTRGKSIGVGFVNAGPDQFIRWMTADELDAAAAVLSALAKGLRDVD